MQQRASIGVFVFAAVGIAIVVFLYIQMLHFGGQ